MYPVPIIVKLSAGYNIGQPPQHGHACKGCDESRQLSYRTEHSVYSSDYRANCNCRNHGKEYIVRILADNGSYQACGAYEGTR